MNVLKRNTWIFYSSQFLYALVFTIPIWIVYYQGRATIAQISLLVALQYAVQLVLELPTGAIADLVGRKISVAAGYFCWVLSSLAIVFSQDFTGLLIGTVLGGLGEALISGSLEALVYDSCKAEKKEHLFAKISATNGILFQIALATATIAGAFLYGIYEGLPYLLYAGCCFASVVLSLFFIEPPIDSETFSLSNYKKQLSQGFREAFRSKPVMLMSLFYIAVAGITWTNNLYFFEFILIDLGFTVTTRGFFSGFIRIINISVLRMLLQQRQLFTRRRSILFFPLIMIVCFLPAIFFEGWGALPFVAGAVMAGTARWIILSQYTNDMFRSKYRATAISALSMLTGCLFIAITLLSGPIIASLGGVRSVYTILGIISLLIVLPLALRIVRETPHETIVGEEH